MPPKSPIQYTSEKSLATLQIVRLRSGECVPVTDLSDSEIIEIALVHVDIVAWFANRRPWHAIILKAARDVCFGSNASVS
jgi:hypothetical protein